MAWVQLDGVCNEKMLNDENTGHLASREGSACQRVYLQGIHVVGQADGNNNNKEQIRERRRQH